MILCIYTCLFLQFRGQQFALSPEFSDRSNKSWWFSVCSAFYLFLRIQWWLLSSWHDKTVIESLSCLWSMDIYVCVCVYIYIWSNFILTSKLNRKYRHSIHALPRHMHSLPHYQHPPLEWYICYHPWTKLDSLLSPTV